MNGAAAPLYESFRMGKSPLTLYEMKFHFLKTVAPHSDTFSKVSNSNSSPKIRHQISSDGQIDLNYLIDISKIY